MTLFPALPPSTFTRDLVALNGFNTGQFRNWLLKPGMAYNDPEKWWGNQGPRPSPHEGIDLVSYQDQNEQVHQLEPGTLIPLLYPGKIVRIFNDLVARTVVAGHDYRNTSGWVLHTFYAHMVVLTEVSPGLYPAPGEAVGTIASPAGSSGCPAHLHVSAAWVSPDTPPEKLRWQEFASKKIIAGIDPLTLINT
ncbi:MAG: hypothetical protein KKG35_06485 [Proteobacteria bacterium]|nr:hypothetical protein [Pseudomonadota bacterium]